MSNIENVKKYISQEMGDKSEKVIDFSDICTEEEVVEAAGELGCIAVQYPGQGCWKITKVSTFTSFGKKVPNVKVGDIVTLGNIWDGEGEVPTDSYSYQVHVCTWLNYEFEVVEGKENPLQTEVKITSIELL